MANNKEINHALFFLKLIFITLLVLERSCHGSLALDTLFDFDEPVAQFTQDNFTSTVTRSDVAWIIDFYSSWCGHCQRFVPVWVELARKVKGWNSFVKVGALACSDPKNSAVCRLYNIWGYPTVKFFGMNANYDDRGSTYNGLKTVDALRRGIIDYLNATTSMNGVTLRPVKSIGEARAMKTPATKSLFLVATNNSQNGKRLGKATILDLSFKYPEVVVVWSYRSFLNSYGITEFPSLYIVKESVLQRVKGKGEFVSIIANDNYKTTSSNETLTTDANSLTTDAFNINGKSFLKNSSNPSIVASSNYVTTVIPWLTTALNQNPSFSTVEQESLMPRGSKNIDADYTKDYTNENQTTTHTPSRLTQTSASKNPHIDVSLTTGKLQIYTSDSWKNNEKYSRDSTTPVVPFTKKAPPEYKVPRGLHSQDLDSSVYYSFWIEIGSHNKISGVTLKALKRYVRLMTSYHKGSTYVVKFIKRVHNWLSGVKGSLNGKEWVSNITALQKRNAFVPQRISWSGCKGSSDKFRGYPCSLWMTFHSFSVNAYIANIHRPKQYDPTDVLLVMKDYIQHFFGCRECAKHFRKMARGLEQEVIKGHDGILWLWRAHNKVNNRLHGDATEDPRHSKVQFPVGSVCQDCRPLGSGRYNDDVTWNEDRVLAYLISFYRPENMIRDSRSITYSKHFKKRGEGLTTTLRPQTTKLVKTTVPPKKKSNIKHKHRKYIDRKQKHIDCAANSTVWSECSKSCGVGVSSRVSSENTDCVPQLQFRLCQLRPCNAMTHYNGALNKMICEKQKNVTTYRGAEKRRLRYNNCQSVHKYIWKYCSNCPNTCCRPTDENTVTLQMECKKKKQTYFVDVDVMKINYCKCKNAPCAAELG